MKKAALFSVGRAQKGVKISMKTLFALQQTVEFKKTTKALFSCFPLILSLWFSLFLSFSLSLTGSMLVLFGSTQALIRFQKQQRQQQRAKQWPTILDRQRNHCYNNSWPMALGEKWPVAPRATPFRRFKVLSKRSSQYLLVDSLLCGIHWQIH